MPDTDIQLKTTLSPEQLARTKRDADYINQKHKADGKSYGESLGKDSFLKLLVTELTHQDPTKPMNDREFIAQMAQFSSLEQMNNVNTQMQELNRGNQVSEAYSLIGKEIESLDADTGRPIRGTVSHVIRRKDGILLAVGSNQVRLEDIHAVYPAKKAEAPIPPAPVQQPAPKQDAASPLPREEETEEPLITGQESTEKGMRNSFNKFDSIYDNKSSQYRQAEAAYLKH